MADEEIQEDEGQKELTRREARIQELTRRNTELERLVNMDNRLQETARVTQQTAQTVGQIAQKMNQPVDQEDDKWTPFLKPKMGKILDEVLAPYKNAIFQLADKNDRLETMVEFPEYKDPEIQKEVEDIRNLRAQNGASPEPRTNIITFLRGRNPEKFVGKTPTSAEDKQNRQEDANQVHVESRITSTPPNRGAVGKTLNLDTASAADIEKWATETGVGKELI
jgi:hypothetical protein